MIGRPLVAVDEASAELEAQLTDFFGAHYDRLVRLAALVCHAGGSVDDAVQAAMEQAWRRRHTLRDPARLRPWLDQVVVREAIRLNRRPWWSRLGDAFGRDAERGREDVDVTGGVNPTWLALVAAFRRLPVEQRTAIALHLYEGYSVDETAELMGAGIETTRSRLRLGRNRLRRELGEDPR
jgi:RNA polymerase sigma-70 factor, ECF subfamily